MDNSPLNILFWTASFGLWFVICFLIARYRHFARFPILCTYLIYSMLFHATALIIMLVAGQASDAYRLFFFPAVSCGFLLAAAVYLRIYSLPDGFRLRRDWHLLIALILVLLFEFWTVSELSYKLLSGGNLICGYLGLATLFRAFWNRHRYHIGATLGWVTIGLLIPSLIYGISQVNEYFSFGLAGLDFAHVLRLTTLVSWLILAYALSRNEPPRPTRLPRIDQKTAQERMLKNAQELWRTT